MSKYIIFFSIFLIACSNEKAELYSDTITRFSINYEGDSLVIGQINYKETKIYDSKNNLVSKNMFDKKGQLKGSEKLIYSNGNAKSEYRLVDNSLLSFYEYKIEEGFLLEKKSFDASNNVLLRIEQYSYDNNGNQTEKIIMNADKIISRVYKFAFDDFGNELGFSVFDEKGKIILLETYKITEMDNDNKWIKKWAERDSTIKSYYERAIEKI